MTSFPMDYFAKLDRVERPLPPGQRVVAQPWAGSLPALAVVVAASREVSPSRWRHVVQFEPHGAHYHLDDVSCMGDASGWTEREYRVAREEAITVEHARAVEAERRERYPDAAFSTVLEEEGS